MEPLHRCRWVGSDPLMIAYHDFEWGVPVHDDHTLFEFLVLEGAQAGLSWTTILRKRDSYREAFAGFYPATVALFDERKRNELLMNPGIVRNRLKVESTIENARAFLDLQERHGSFDAYVWQFVGGGPIQNQWEELSAIPAETAESKKLSRELKKHGFRFVGPTICYAFMQAVGLVNDHTVDCFRHAELAGAL